MDTRLLIMFSPLAVALSWVVYNIGRVALQQFKQFSR
uniref:Photosystem II reaction center protein Y n=1 Tax=Olisthodiscus luteus TaxID=83000 RepID=A0A7U0KSU4_OLILU|nr:photosystem II protein Y [Olisthodiscus luteus]QQW50478.1 photosystem II protein Y [Olisthodiscus luteus]